uniref:Uncharacterized protein n=1 Tax=Aureoumbra lagunensis TaxID=44058 RepID=A0A7S3K3K3_9STRA|mmetsp:Transcript_12272/g.16559  ORF Transcript_12272/g.16559 Transcript_12272/m.16559 type:complete len:223 (+) Transcript_12272:77-745(+)
MEVEKSDELRETKVLIGGGLALLAGLAGVSFGISGALIFPFVPSTIAGSILGVTSVATCGAAGLVLCSHNIRIAAHKAFILVIMIQIASAFTMALITTGARYNFCDTRKPCYVFLRAVETDDKCISDDGKACIADYSYLCHKTVYYDDQEMVFLGNKNCDTTLSDRCNGGDRFWGFDDREDCLSFYVKNRKHFAPNLSTGLILSGAFIQLTCTAILTLLLRA